MIPPIVSAKMPQEVPQKIFDESAQIGAKSPNENQNRLFQRVSFPFSTRVLPSSPKHKPVAAVGTGAAAGI